VVSSDEIAPREILLLEESWAKAHTDWRHFKKVLYENDLKIKNKPNPYLYNEVICRPSQSRETIPLKPIVSNNGTQFLEKK
jgi:hypothetical protein